MPKCQNFEDNQKDRVPTNSAHAIYGNDSDLTRACTGKLRVTSMGNTNIRKNLNNPL